MINAIHIEDEPRNIELLDKLINSNFTSQINMLGSATNIVDGYDLIVAVKPQLIFLDIELKRGNAFELLDKRISEICGVNVTSNHPTQEASRKFCIRIVRPQRNTDNNPPHRDVWLDRLRNAINIYLPLAGSNNKSSLPIIVFTAMPKSLAMLCTTVYASGCTALASNTSSPSFIRKNPAHCSNALLPRRGTFNNCLRLLNLPISVLYFTILSASVLPIPLT